MSVRIGSGKHTYEWIDNWARIPDSQSARAGWAHPGVAVTEAGEVISFHQGDPTVLVFDREGNLRRSFDTGLTEGHGMALVKEGDTEYLWIADTGSKRDYRAGYEYPATSRPGQAVKMTLDGRVVMTIRQPDLPIYREGKFSPTSVAVNEERHGGNGDVWVADGYGQSHVHRYSRYNKAGEYLGSINGQEGAAGAFKTPHGLWIDTRGSEPELYVADRGNGRVQVYDLDGNFKRVFGSDFLTTPCAFAVDGDLLVIAELRARLAVVDPDEKLVCYLGANEAVCDLEGWPNMKNERGEIVRTNRLAPGKFNSPHGIAVDADGNVYVAEWLIGGRMTKLVKI